MSRKAARVDRTSADLVAAARQMGAKVLILNHVIDAVVEHRGKLYLVDWKTARGKKQPRIRLTKAQEALTAEGWPIHYLADVESLQRLLGVK